jgi:Fe2+ transport system protein FeoA
MRLDQIKKDGIFRVTKVNCENESIARLMSMVFQGCHMSLRLKDAAEVEVEKI